MNQEKMNKSVALAKKLGIVAEYKFAPEEAHIDTWDMLQKSEPKFDKDLNLTKGPKPYANRNNIALILENDPIYESLCYNDHSNKVIWKQRELWDPDLEDIGLHIERAYNIRYTSPDIKRAVLRVAHKNIQENVKDWVTNLPSWDGEPRIHNLFRNAFRAQIIPGSEQLIQEMSSKWIISLIARVMKPGCKMDNFLILCGEKGLGKSTGLKTLIGEDWFSDSPLDIGKKDSLELIHSTETWLWELAELHSLQGRTADNFKAFISSAEDKFRPSYQQFPKSYLRRVVFAGTSNNYQFLSDGPERRVWPITVTAPVDLEYLRTWREQIFAEGLAEYLDGNIWYLEWESQRMLSELQQAYIIDDPWAIKVREAIVTGKNNTTDIMNYLDLPVSQQHTGNAKRIAQICKESGYKQVIKDGQRVWIRK
jgi:putative DNA primase/helicase